MQPAAFDYRRPGSLNEALELLSELEDARPLAGGHSLLPVMKMRLASPGALIDLGRISELAGIRRDGDELRIGAMTVYADIAASGAVLEGCPALAETVSLIGDRQVRNRGTIGGSVSHADPAADLPTLLVALDATVVSHGLTGERETPAREFFLGTFTTALGPGELVTAVRVPVTPGGTGAAYVKHPHPASRYAVAAAAARVTVTDGVCEAADLAVGGVTGGPVLVTAAADRLVGSEPAEEALAEAAATVTEALENPMGDVYASGEYRVHLAAVLARRALHRAVERAAG